MAADPTQEASSRPFAATNAKPFSLAATLNRPFSMFWKKKKVDTSQESKIILGMVLLDSEQSFNVGDFKKDFDSNYSNNTGSITGDNFSLIFTVDGETISIGHIQAPIPLSDIEATTKYAYNWQTAPQDTVGHKTHLIISIMQGGQNQIKRFRILTQVICSLLRITDSIGVYKGAQSLLIPKEDYLNEAETMTENHLPLNLWVYFGLLVTESGNSGYTHGLKEFNKTEMEVVNSSKDPADIRYFLFNISHYVLAYNVTFQDGQTCGLSENEKVAIRFSKGHFIEGDTFKLAY